MGIGDHPGAGGEGREGGKRKRRGGRGGEKGEGGTRCQGAERGGLIRCEGKDSNFGLKLGVVGQWRQGAGHACPGPGCASPHRPASHVGSQQCSYGSWLSGFPLHMLCSMQHAQTRIATYSPPLYHWPQTLGRVHVTVPRADDCTITECNGVSIWTRRFDVPSSASCGCAAA